MVMIDRLAKPGRDAQCRETNDDKGQAKGKPDQAAVQSWITARIVPGGVAIHEGGVAAVWIVALDRQRNIAVLPTRHLVPKVYESEEHEIEADDHHAADQAHGLRPLGVVSRQDLEDTGMGQDGEHGHGTNELVVVDRDLAA